MANKISAKARIETEAEKLTGPIAEKHGVRIYDVEYVKEGPEAGNSPTSLTRST